MTIATAICTQQHKAFFEAFGYLHFPGLLNEDIGWIREEYEAVWNSRPDIVHGANGQRLTSFPNLFVSWRPRLSGLIEDPRIVEICETLLGDGYAVNGGDGTLWDGDTSWHSDVVPEHWGIKSVVKNIKIAIYPDQLTHQSGALRVLPGSHLHGDAYCERMHDLCADPDRMVGVPGNALPAVTLASRPGDVIVFDHRIKHGAFGGGIRRRQFCLNCMGPTSTTQQREAMLTLFRWYRDHQAADWTFPDGWVESMPPARRRRMQATLDIAAQVIEEKRQQGASGSAA
jgi:hypothetical protein